MRLCLAFALSLFAVCAHAEPPAAALHSRYVIAAEGENFGGLSGILIRDQGRSALVVSDLGTLFWLRLERDGQNRISAVQVIARQALFRPGEDGGLNDEPDTEGLAEGADGSVFVSLERPSAVMQVHLGQRDGTFAPDLPRLHIRNLNRGTEALAIDAQGRFVAMPEAVPPNAPGFPVLRLESGVWKTLSYLPKRGDFLIVGADFGPDGLLYVAERAVSLLGFRTRVRRFDPEAPAETEETLIQTPLARYDNLEGLSVWQDAAGAIRLTLVSDNNFLSVQKQELVEFILK